jgi:hypothetical protein
MGIEPKTNCVQDLFVDVGREVGVEQHLCCLID